ncbi:MAG: LysO family transporter [Fermentimonas sp.]|jgi:uncharacterized membrane protein YbjE (DUF340 family)
MVYIFLAILLGIAIGFATRKSKIIAYTNKIIEVIIMILLFLLGIDVGSKEEIVSNFSILGMEALIITLGATLGSLLLAKWVYSKYFKEEE